MGNEHYKNLGLANIVGEVWKDIENFEGYYQVSNMGRVKSLERKSWNGKNHYTVREKIRKQPHPNTKQRYLAPCMSLKMNNEHTSKSVSSLVANAFIDNPHNHPLAFHKSKNYFDNKVSNLYWGDKDNLTNICSHIYKDKGHSSSSYRGVNIVYRMDVIINGLRIIKVFKTEIEAAKKYDYYVKKYKLNRELNFPDEK